jgi:hypothetical protein
LFWQEGYRDRAIAEFNAAVRTEPEWRTPEWVRALYSPTVVESVEAMQKESERRERYVVIRQ